MRAVVRIVLLVLLVVACCRGASARDDGPGDRPPADPLAEAVAAARAGDVDRLRELSLVPVGGPWALADALYGAGDAEAALALARAWPHDDAALLIQYLDGREELSDPEGLRDLLDDVAADLRAGNHSSALGLLEVAEPHPDSVLAVLVAEQRGHAFSRLDRLLESAEAYREAAGTAARIGWRRRAADRFYDAGASAFHAREFVACRTCFQRAHALYKALGLVRRAARLLASLATATAAQTDYAGAVRRYEQAVAALSGPDDLTARVRTLGNLGLVLRRMGRYARALSVEEEALGAVEALGDPLEEAEILLNLGMLYNDVGRYDDALARSRRALGIFEAQLEEGEKRPSGLPASRRRVLLGGRARAIGNLGITYWWQGDVTAYIEAQRQALAIFDQELQDDLMVAHCQQNLAEGYRANAEFAAAIFRHRAALKRLREAGATLRIALAQGEMGRTHREAARHESVRAREAMAAGRDAQAATHRDRSAAHSEKAAFVYGEALASARRLKARALEVQLLEGLAGTHLGAGHPAEALASALEALDALPEVVGRLTEGEGAGARHRRLDLFEAGTQAAVALGDLDAALRFLEGGRAGALLEALGGRAALRSVVVPETLRDLERDARSRRIAALEHWRSAHRENDRPALQRWDAELTKTSAALDGIRERIQREAKRAADVVYPRPDDRATIQARLQPDEALLIYGLSDDASVALVVTHAGTRPVELAPRAVLEAACDAALLAKEPFVDPEGLRALAPLLVDPLHLDESIRRVLLSPHGVLAYVPFAPLLPRREVVYVPSGTTYGVLRSFPSTAEDGEILALGDPAYGAGSPAGPQRGGRGGTLARLERSRDEALAIGDVVLLGPDASEARLRETLAGHEGRWRAVHFACHGLADAEHPALSSLALTRTGDDDGFLTALEVFGLSIPADLVVLSACESGKGRIVLGEGLIGLTRAFMYAGAPRVLVSLWRVEDDATAVFMTAFYRLWKDEGWPAARALREAQERVQAQGWEHPRHWAAWVLWGLPD